MTQLTVNDLLTEFLDGHRAQNHSERTVLWYAEQCNRFLAWLQASDLHRGD